MRELDIRLSAFLSIVIFVVILLLKDSIGAKELGSALTSAVFYVVFTRFLFVKWIWKWIPLLEKIHGVPFVEGTWVGTYKSSYIDPETKENKTGDVKVRIVQPNLFTVKVSQMSGDSNSSSYAEQLETKVDKTVRLTYSYLVEPKANVRDRHQISYASANYLLTHDEGTLKLSGNYWTDQGTTGFIEMTKLK